MPTGLLISTVCTSLVLTVLGFVPALLSPSVAEATPANRAALERYYDKFLAKDLNRCSTCHLPSNNKAPEDLDEFPHNPFGNRLRLLRKELRADGKKADIAARLKIIAKEDSDGDGVSNETEILLGHNPGDAQNTPNTNELTADTQRSAEYEQY